MFGLETSVLVLLIVCILAVCAFEFINGFHDTANAVATVIYTHAMKPMHAVVWSGIMNFVGVYVGGIAVAMGIVNLLPLEALIDQNIYHSIAMILSLVVTAIFWNIGTWYLGIPCSSSHTLIGSIFGVCIAFMFIPGNESVALNLSKVKDVGLSLLISPVFGFGLTLLLMLLLKKLIKDKTIFKEPDHHKVPPFWIRLILILTCTSVSFSHGSNDGQKGVGLVMIILIGLIPTFFALDHSKKPQELYENLVKLEKQIDNIKTENLSIEDKLNVNLLSLKLDSMKHSLEGIQSFEKLDKEKHFELRKDIITFSNVANKFIKRQLNESQLKLSNIDKKTINNEIKSLKSYTEYAPSWVIIIISISLGLGTMIGWKRIVVTIGEKIGNSPLTYAQGASAELVAASTIFVSSQLGLPVSTTHVLSSGIMGSMVAKKRKGNLRMKTVKNILIAWLITVPVTIVMAGGLFLLLRLVL